MPIPAKMNKNNNYRILESTDDKSAFYIQYRENRKWKFFLNTNGGMEYSTNLKDAKIKLKDLIRKKESEKIQINGKIYIVHT
jgi:hypothetical protein